MTRIKKDEIDKWINSPEGKKALEEAHERTEKYLKERNKAKEWDLLEWIRIMFTPYKA